MEELIAKIARKVRSLWNWNSARGRRAEEREIKLMMKPEDVFASHKLTSIKNLRENGRSHCRGWS